MMFFSVQCFTEKDYLPITMSLTEGSYYVYFRSNATGWQPNADTLMSSIGNDLWVKEFEVTLDWMLTSPSDHTISITNELNGWGSDNQDLSDASYQTTAAVIPFSSTASVNAGAIKVIYPEKKHYKVLFNVITKEYTISDDLSIGLTTTNTLVTTTTINIIIPQPHARMTLYDEVFSGQKAVLLGQQDIQHAVNWGSQYAHSGQNSLRLMMMVDNNP